MKTNDSLTQTFLYAMMTPAFISVGLTGYF
jgi:hypothetical protein